MAEVISAEDFKKSIDYCCQDPQLKSYYRNAPAGARLYIGLVFYATCFGENADVEQYETCFNEILPELSEKDIRYLLRFEKDPDSVEALKNQLEMLGTKTEVAPEVHIRELPTMYRTQVGGDKVANLPEESSARPSVGRRKSEYQLQLEAARRQRITHGFLRVVMVVLILLGLVIVWKLVGENLGSSVKNFKQDIVEKIQEITPDASTSRADRQVADQEQSRLKIMQESEKEERLQRERSEREALQEREKSEREKRLAEQEAEVAARRKMEEQLMAARRQYNEVKNSFRNATCDVWRNAPREDRPGSVKVPTIFYCLVPQGSVDYDIYRLQAEPEKEISVALLHADAISDDVPFKDFLNKAGRSPHLLMVENRAYLSVPESSVGKSFPITKEDFSPLEKEYGALYGIARRLGISKAPVAFDVMFRPSNGVLDIPLGVVSWGGSISHYDIFNKVSEALASAKAARANRVKGRTTKKRTVVFGKGTTIHRRLDGVVEVPRNFIYTSSNRHRYYWYGHDYEDEVRKEELARAKWQELYDEAVRQEKAEEENSRPADPEKFRPTDSEVEDALRSGSLVYRMKK